MPTVAIITDEVGWHSNRIGKAFQKHGCDVYFTALPEYIFSTADADSASFSSSSTRKDLPDVAFVRCIPTGEFEQIVFYLDVLYAYEQKGVCVCNNARVIEHSVDKMMTSFLLQNAGLPTPKTWAAVHREYIEAVIATELERGNSLVMKPLFGSQGKGLQLINKDYPNPNFIEGVVYYLQEFIDNRDDNGQWHDWRLFVIDGVVVAAMKRIGNNWINNIAQGSQGYRATANREMMQCAVKAAAVIGTIYAGVDLIQDQQGQCWLTEVNSIPAWKGLQAVTNIDIADRLATDILRRL